MNKQLILKSIVAAIATGFGMWIVAGLWHNLIMPTLYTDTHATHEGIGIMLIAYLVLAFFMVYLYTQIHYDKNPIKEGFKLGMVIGILWVFPHELVMAGAHEGKSISYVFKNALWHMIEQGIGGMIMGLIFRKMNGKVNK